MDEVSHSGRRFGLEVRPRRCVNHICCVLSSDLQLANDAGQSCQTSFTGVRLKYTIAAENRCFGMKHSVTLAYTVDTGKATLCKGEPRQCKGGSGAASRTIGTRESPTGAPMQLQAVQEYWDDAHWMAKAVVQCVCWSPTEQDPDVNVRVHIHTTVRSTGTQQREIEEFEGDSDLCAYAKELGRT
jgi:hypothetical protein